ncbi:MAG: nucleoside recognition domain-containing protein, partial [Bullifex porci]
VVSTFGILFGFAEVAEDGAEIWGTMAQAFTSLSGFSFLVFNLLCAPCFAAIGAIKREMNDKKWLAIAIFYQCIFAYIVSFMIYQIGSLIVGSGNIIGGLLGIVVFAAMIYLLICKPKSVN